MTAAGTSARQAAAGTSTRLDTPAAGQVREGPDAPDSGHVQQVLDAPGSGQAREMPASPGSEVVVLVGKDPGMTTTVSKPGREPAAPSREQAAPTAAAGLAHDGAAHAGPAHDQAAHDRPAHDRSGDDLFARYTRDYVTERFGQQIMILQAGCTTAGTDLEVGSLRAEGADISVSLIDDDQPVTRAAVGIHEALHACVPGDLRTVPLPPRSQDIVLCSLLLHRIKHAELVLDRLVAGIKPGGLLLLRFGDRDSAAGFLDRRLPRAVRGAIWRRRRPGEPGPYPAVYERLSSARGVQVYALMRGLVITERRALGGLAGALAGPPGFLAIQKVIARLSGGRLTDAHEELLYVLRKPENRFARVI